MITIFKVIGVLAVGVLWFWLMVDLADTRTRSYTGRLLDRRKR